MTQIHFHESIESFIRENYNYLVKNYQATETLRNLLDKHEAGELSISNAINVRENEMTILGAVFQHYIMIYGDKWSQKMIDLLAGHLPLKDMVDHSFSGQREIILELMQGGNHPFKVISERNIYECRQLLRPVKKVIGSLGVADMNDVKTISKLSYQFQEEEYGGRIEKDEKYMLEQVVIPGIQNETFLKWTAEGEIKSILQFTVDKNSSPTIGHLFTDRKNRGKGYAYALVWNATNTVLQHYDRCSLIANRLYGPSNAVFLKTGYKKIYDWIKVERT